MSPQSNSLPIRLVRFCRLLLHLLAGIATAGLFFPHYSVTRRDRSIVRWARKLLAILHIHVELVGDIPQSEGAGCIIVANHISWLDIFLIHTVCPAHFVAKSEIRDWPLVGWLCAKAGTLFIERERRHHTAKINELMRDAVNNGATIGLFPEGTTTRGDQLRKLHSSLFQAAVESGAPLVPVAIRYTDAQGQRSETAAYIDDMSLAQSIAQIIAAPELYVRLHFAAPIIIADKNRRVLAAETGDALTKLLFPAPPLQTKHGKRAAT